MTAAATQKAHLPPRWVIVGAWHVHRAVYRWSGRKKGLWSPRPGRYGVLWLITTGRRTGRPRGVMIGYFEDGPNLVSMAMNGWGAAEPAWWLNLQANPRAVVELAGGRRNVRGRAATGAERERLWQRWRSIDRNLDGFAARRAVETAVVVLEPEVSTPARSQSGRGGDRWDRRSNPSSTTASSCTNVRCAEPR